VFVDDADRQRFLSILGRTVTLFRWKVHAYVMMGNHFHLLVETPEPTLSRGMRQINGLYTQAFNRRHGRAGHLFQGRFKAILVEKESHLLELCRYIVLNPVRADLVRSAREWRWSSYRATAGLENGAAWLETEWTLRQFGARRSRAREKFRQFVLEGRRGGYEPWKELRGQIYLGSDEFLEDVERRADAHPARRGIPRKQRKPLRVAGEDLFRACLKALGRTREDLLQRTRLLADERRAIAYVLRRHGLLGVREIGELLGVGEGHASIMAASGETEAAGNGTKAQRLEKEIQGGLVEHINET
jgi:putative transposase